MPIRGIQVRPESKIQVEIRQALKRKFASQQDLAINLELALATISNFFNCKPIERGNFERICSKLGLEREKIIDLNPYTDKEEILPQDAKMIVFQGELETPMTEDEALATQLNSLMPPLDSAGVKRQEMLSGIEVTGNLEAGNLIQEAQHGSSVEQKMATGLKAENIKFGNLTQVS